MPFIHDLGSTVTLELSRPWIGTRGRRKRNENNRIRSVNSHERRDGEELDLHFSLEPSSRPCVTGIGSSRESSSALGSEMTESPDRSHVMGKIIIFPFKFKLL